MPSRIQNIVTFISSCMSMATAGAMFSFSVVEGGIKEKLQLSSSDINTITGVGNSSLYLSFLFIGPLYDRIGARWTLFLGALIFASGYLLMFFALDLKIASSTVAMSVYYFIVGIGSTCSYMACVGANVKNLGGTSYEGKALAILLLCYGLSATIFSQICISYFLNNAGGLLLFSAIVVGVVNLIAAAFTFETASLSTLSTEKRSSSIASVQIVSSSNRVQVSKSFESGEFKETIKLIGATSEPESTMQILTSPLFWCFALTLIFMQGLTYMTDFFMILEAAEGQQRVESDPDGVARQNAMHVTIMSVFNSLGRLTIPLFCDLFISYRTKFDRSILLLICQVLALVSTIILAAGAQSQVALIACSVIGSYAFGGAGATFPVLTKDFFGTKRYGTACGLVMAGVPAGILLSNLIFGVFYDAESNGAKKCLTPSCYSKSFSVFSGIQCISIVTAAIVFGLRMSKKQV
ncbi:major facilitator superfamily domain-containing protein [Chytriomyces sp. MP71]|nr:major facilitator superfamily domain-containing protein [Chytriomyces sp. MP71]